MGITTAEAARLSRVPHATLDHLVTGRTTTATPATRKRLVHLGFTELEVDTAAAQSAGYQITPAVVTPEEWVTLLRLRAMRPSARQFMLDEIWKQGPRNRRQRS